MKSQLQELIKVWPAIEQVFSVPHNGKDYDKLVRLLDNLIDEEGEDTSHPLASLVETIGSLIESYEFRHFPDIEGDPIDALKSLMAEHGLRQADMVEIGSQGVVSEVMAGKRQLNRRQIKSLAKRFRVSPSVFL